mgnify:FL=1
MNDNPAIPEAYIPPPKIIMSCLIISFILVLLVSRHVKPVSFFNQFAYFFVVPYLD